MVKKILFILLVSLFAYQGFGQGFAEEARGKKAFNWIRANDITTLDNFIWHGDTIDFNDYSKTFNNIEYVDGWFKFYANDSIVDSVLFTSDVLIQSFELVGDSLYLSLDNGSEAYVDLSSLLNQLDSVTVGYGLTGNGTETDPIELDTSLFETGTLSAPVYRITLPSAQAVADRLTAAVPGTNYPSSWVLSVDTDPIHLVIEHGLGRRVADVSVFTLNGTEERRLVPGATAYSNFYTTDDNTLVIESFSTVQTQVVIYIVFGP